MKCPYCHADNDRVIDSRSLQEGITIRRRRECVACRRRYTTYERYEGIEFKVLKKDGVREPFDPDKLRRGLEKACWKRPVNGEQIQAVITAILHRIYESGEAEVPTDQLGEIVMDELRALDQVAYVRFASVYRQFQDVQDFVDELRPMLKDTPRPNVSP